MTECGKCGDCCEVIAISLSKRDFRVAANGDKPYRGTDFILRNWARISEERARSINPALVRQRQGMKAKYYTCKKFDPITRECMAHDERPDVCRRFPWYDFPVKHAAVLEPYKSCTFWHDLPKDQWPDGVIPLDMV